MRLHPLAHRLAQHLDVRRAGTAEIDEKIAMELRYLRAADGQATAAGVIDQLPRAVARWILESRAAGPVAWLACFALLFDRRHLGSDFVRHARTPLQGCRSESHVIGHCAMAVGKTHVAVAESVDVSLPVDAARFDKNVLGLAAIGAAVHAQRTADR